MPIFEKADKHERKLQYIPFRKKIIEKYGDASKELINKAFDTFSFEFNGEKYPMYIISNKYDEHIIVLCRPNGNLKSISFSHVKNQNTKEVCEMIFDRKIKGV